MTELLKALFTIFTFCAIIAPCVLFSAAIGGTMGGLLSLAGLIIAGFCSNRIAGLIS